MFQFGGDSGYEDEQNELHYACESGTLKDIVASLNSKSVIPWYYDGQTALHTTVLSGRQDAPAVVRTLLEYEADINAKTTGDENTALHCLVQYGSFPRDFDTVMVFLEQQADLSERNKALRTPYDCAIASGQYELAGAIDGTVHPSQARAYYADKIGERYGPYIIEAVLDSDDQKLKKNLEIGGNPNLLNKHGCGAIHYAVTHSRLPVYDTLASLLQHEGDPNLADEEGDTAVNLVIKNESLRPSGEMVRCVQLLVNGGAAGSYRDLDGKDAFTLAEEKGYSDVLAALRKAQTPREEPNQPNADGLYPLHVATSIDHELRRHTRVNLLLEQGAEVSQATVNTGDTALHLCAEKDYGTTAEILLAKDIDYNIKNYDDKTAYDIAQELGHESVVGAITERQEASDRARENWQKGAKKAKFCTIL